MTKTRISACAGAAAILLVSAGAAVGAGAVDPTGMIHGCYKTNNGQLRVVAAAGSCGPSEQAIAWSQAGPAGEQGPQGEPGVQGQAGPSGPQGAPGVFSGRFDSPSGLFSISVTDAGIELVGPSGSVRVGAGVTEVNGAVVQLNGCDAPVARKGDLYAGGHFSGTIVSGSPTVCTGQ